MTELELPKDTFSCDDPKTLLDIYLDDKHWEDKDPETGEEILDHDLIMNLNMAELDMWHVKDFVKDPRIKAFDHTELLAPIETVMFQTEDRTYLFICYVGEVTNYTATRWITDYYEREFGE